MKSICIALLVCLGIACPGFADDVKTTATRLPDGIRLIYVHVPSSKNIAIFTFLPMGLAEDDAHRAQWSQVVEHLTIRTTMPDDLTHGNAETLADHMRLDYYGPADSWREGLSHHKRWLQGIAFTEQSLKTEVPRAKSEVDSTARNLACGKFAIAAWDQAFRHGLDHAAIKQDLVDARIADVQRHRDEHLFVPDRTIVCAIGGVDATQLMLTWPVPGPQKPDDCAALMVLGRLVMMQAANHVALKAQVGPFVLAGNDLTSPEGAFFMMRRRSSRASRPRRPGRPLRSSPHCGNGTPPHF